MIFYSFTDENASAANQHKSAHGLLSEVLKSVFGIENYSLFKHDRGKPYLENYPEIFFNLSHCKGLSVCGISNSEIGVDAELIRPYSGKAAKRIFTENEIRFIEKSANSDESFFRLWTLKEAVGKAIGTGIFSGMKDNEFYFADGRFVCPNFPEKIFSQKIILDKWIVSVCSETDENEFTEIDTKKIFI